MSTSTKTMNKKRLPPSNDDDDDLKDSQIATKKTNKKKNSTLFHCMRCHEDYNPKLNNARSCIIEHDDDSFCGSRNGGSWYTGKVLCCGASYKFHRYYSDVIASPKYCFEGHHTMNQHDVCYNNKTICICNEEECGRERYVASKQVYEKQKQDEIKRKEDEKKRLKEREKKEHGKFDERMKKLTPDQRRREERKERARNLGLYYDSDEMNSDINPDDCDEFDYADDDSIVPPWELDSDY